MARRKKYPYLYNIPRGSDRWYLWAGKGSPRYCVKPDAPDFNKFYGNFRSGIVPKKLVQPEAQKPSKTFQYGLLQVCKPSPFITWKDARKRQIRGLLDEVADEWVNADKTELGKVGDLALD